MQGRPAEVPCWDFLIAVAREQRRRKSQALLNVGFISKTRMVDVGPITR